MDDNTRRWSLFLDRLEDSIAVARCHLEDPSAPLTGDLFVAPDNLGELPAELTARAQFILEAQHRLFADMRAAHEDAGRQLNAVRSVPRPDPGSKSVYLDVTG